jgi:DNA mismatch repair protein MSH4
VHVICVAAHIQAFTNLRALLSRMVDFDALIAACSAVPRIETVRTAESKITQAIYLKHTLELIPTLRQLFVAVRTGVYCLC